MLVLYAVMPNALHAYMVKRVEKWTILEPVFPDSRTVDDRWLFKYIRDSRDYSILILVTLICTVP
jgi:hypothetical protein